MSHTLPTSAPLGDVRHIHPDGVRPVHIHAFRDDALGDGDATEVARRIAAGEVSAAETVEAAIARLEDVDGALGAMAFPDFERARRRASHVPRIASPGATRAPFAGVPTAFKDNVTVAGMPCTMGSRAMDRRPQPRNGGFVEQFLDTGVIPVCTTTMPPFGWTATSERVGGDITRNPWHPAYSSGGSSGGSAALVASGVLPFAHGNDGGGSIRIPAAACGLFGLKPTRGRVRTDPTTKAMPVDIVSNGVLTRSVRDTANFFAAMERIWANPKLPPIGLVQGSPARRLRIGMVIDSPVAAATDADTRAAVEDAGRLLAGLGHEVEPYAATVPQTFKRDFEDYWAMLAWGIVRDGKRLFGPNFDRATLDPLTLGLAKRFHRRAAAAPVALARLRASARMYERKMVSTFDVVISPVLRHTTPEIGHLSADLPWDVHFERLVDYANFTPLHNAAGVPAMSVPLGETPDGLPIGIMFSGRAGSERTLLQLAFEVEQARPFRLIHAA